MRASDASEDAPPPPWRLDEDPLFLAVENRGAAIDLLGRLAILQRGQGQFHFGAAVGEAVERVRRSTAVMKMDHADPDARDIERLIGESDPRVFSAGMADEHLIVEGNDSFLL